jgi:hypothetical protein
VAVVVLVVPQQVQALVVVATGQQDLLQPHSPAAIMEVAVVVVMTQPVAQGVKVLVVQ